MQEKNHSVKEKVMESVRNKKVTMRSHFAFMLEKLGLESALAGAIIFGALFVSILFYFFKKTGILKFLSLGVPGLKIFLLALPYDYIALVIFFIILAIYFANQIELFCGNCTRTDYFALYFFAGSLLLGILFGIIGVGEYFQGWSQKNVPRESAICGKIQNFSQGEVLVEDERGETVRVFLTSPEMKENEYETGKILRAIGTRDTEDDNLFHAEVMRCCDED
jgi:hypothetical protein